MSTPNFETMKDFPLVCGGAFSEYRDRYIEEFREEPTDDEVYDEIIYDANCKAKKAEELTDNLRYYDVTIADGYYDGWQFMVKARNGFDEDFFDPDSKYCLDNEDAHYWFDECRSKVLRGAKAERNKINKWLHKQSKSDLMHEPVCVAIFDNGEAIYEEA